MEGVIEVSPQQVDALYDSGRELPYVDFGAADPALKLDYAGEAYWYYRTLPLKGYSAVLGRYVREKEAEDHRVLLARFHSRIYIYATGIVPIGAGKAPGA